MAEDPEPQQGPFLYEFFISYSRLDSNLAAELGEALEYYGVSVWFAEFKILLEGRERLQGSVLEDELRTAAAQSRRCILIASEHSIKSQWVGVELSAFRMRGSDSDDVIFGIETGAPNEEITRFVTTVVGSHLILKYSDYPTIDQLMHALLERAGISTAGIDRSLAPVSRDTSSQCIVVRTDKRKIGVVFELGSEWEWTDRTLPRKLSGFEVMYTDCRNRETGMRFNLIAGPMTQDYSWAGRTEDVDERLNPMAASFVRGKIRWLGEGVRPGHRAGIQDRVLLARLALRSWLHGLVFRRQEVLGSQVVNIGGACHFAFTYRVRLRTGQEMITRKYSVMLKPEGADRLFEFVFSAGYPGSHRDFLRRIGRVNRIVRSMRLASEGEVAAQDLFNRGMQRYDAGDYAAAVPIFTAGIDMRGRDERGQSSAGAPFNWGVFYFQRGMAHRHLRAFREAAADLETAAAIEQSSEMRAQALYNGGVVLEKLGEDVKALAHYTDAVELKPDHGPAWCNRGNMMMGLGRYEEAHASHSRALELDPRDFHALYSRANCNLELGRDDEARADFRAFLRYAPPGHPGRQQATAFLE
jgi:tetratricopeptide (TPR) repeat protein